MGMEKMLGAMIGMTPEQMQQKANEFEGFVKSIATGIVQMNEKLDELLHRLPDPNIEPTMNGTKILQEGQQENGH